MARGGDEVPAVLFVSISGWLGGPGRSLATLLANLPSGVERILAAPDVGDLLPWVQSRGLAEVHLSLPRSYGRIRAKEAGRLVAVYRVTRWILANRRRLVAVHANGFTELHLAALGAALAGVPVVGWFHGYGAGRWDRRLGPLWRRVLRRRTLVAVSRTARAVVCQSGLAHAGEVMVIPNPIDDSDVSGRPRRRREGGRPTVGYLGTSIRDKGFHLLPEIIERVGDRPVEWLLFLTPPAIGGGAQSSTWERLVALSLAPGRQARVTFAGRLPEVRLAYESCDVVLCPSLRESFSRITSEAMANGVPVVTSDLEPLRDLLGEGEAGLLFPPGDAPAAAEAVGRLLDDPDLAAALGRCGRERTASFGAPAIAGRFATLYGLHPGSHGAAALAPPTSLGDLADHGSGPKAAAVVWQYWEDVPGRVRPAYLDLCMETVRRHTGGLEVRLLDFNGVLDWLPDIDPDVWRRLPGPPARSDYARARLLDRYGGLWLDVDTIAFRPLDQLVALLDGAEVAGWGSRDGFLSNFMAARPHGELLEAWILAQDEALKQDVDWGTLPYAFLNAHVLRPLADRIGYHALGESQVAPVPWNEWRRFLSRLEPPGRVLAGDPPVVVLWNAVMGPPLRHCTRSDILGGTMLLSRLLRIALGSSTVVDESRGLTWLEPLSRLRFSYPGLWAEFHVRRSMGRVEVGLRRLAGG